MTVTPSGGDVAQLVEHLLCKQEVVGSSPVVSTITITSTTVPGALSDPLPWTPTREENRTRRDAFEPKRSRGPVDVLFDK